MRTCSRTRPVLSASCSAKASGAFRDPGHSTTSRTPPRISSSTTMRACVVEGLTTTTACHIRLDGPAEELQRSGVHGVGPLDETQVPGIGYLQVAALRDRIGHLLAQ